MPSTDPSTGTTGSLESLRQVDERCDRFLKAWKAGGRPRIEDELASSPTDIARDLLAELVNLEIELRAAAGERVTDREFAARFPDLDPAVARDAIARVAINRATVFSPARGAVSAAPAEPVSDVRLADESITMSPDELAESLAKHGVASASLVARVRRRLPVDRADDVAALLAELTASGGITAYQAERIRAGRIADLVFGDYVILDRIGRGGMGEVLKARQRRMDRLVALKVISERGLQNASVLERFRQEVKAAAHLQHANIVTAFDAGEERGVPFLVMEYVAGEDLATRVRRDGPLSIEQAADCIRQVAKGLDYAHRKGIIHRDIKPANLLLDDEGTVKILDLGLARLHSQLAVDEESETHTGGELTASGDVLGTLDFLPPEQAESSRKADARSDVYSLGCTLWWLLTGHAVYVRETKVERLVAHQTAPPPSLFETRPDAPAELADLCRRMLAKRPADRPQTMRDVLEALKPLATGDSTLGGRADDTAAPADPALTAFLRASDPTIARARTAAAPAVRLGKWRWLPWVTLAAAFTGVIVAAAVIIRLNTPEGTLVLEINQPDARVQVFNAEGKVEIDQPGGNGKVTLSVDPGRHEVRIEKDGFRLYAKEFSVVDGETATIRARLVANQKQKAVTRVSDQVTIEPRGAGEPLSADPHRRAAEVVLRHGGTMFVISAQGQQAIARIEDLPLGPFVVDNISVINRPDFDDDDLHALTGVRFLWDLKLIGSGVTDAGLEALRGTDVINLDLTSNPVSDAGLKALSGRADLLALHLGFCQISDAAAADLATFPRLRNLSLAYCQVGDGANASLTKLPLRFFSPGSKCTAVGLEPLTGMPTLQEVSLVDLPLDDSAADVLARCPQLHSLDLRGTKITTAGVQRIQAALPGAFVWHPDARPLDSERAALDWALRAGATAAGFENGVWSPQLPAAPAEPFVVDSLSFAHASGTWAHEASALTGLSHISKLGGQDLIGADDVAEHLAQLQSLREIDLSGSDLTDVGLERLTALEGLEQLYLRRCAALSGDGLRHLTAFPHLWYLHLDSGGFIDADIEHVGNVVGLQVLGLDSCQGLTSDALRHLRPLSILRVLNLDGTPIDDTAVEHLAAMPGLRFLSLRKSQVTRNGIERLRQALPDCAILWDDGMVVPGERDGPDQAAAH